MTNILSTVSNGGGVEVIVEAGYRIHMGFYRFLDTDISFGALGAAISSPEIRVSAKECDNTLITCESSYARDLVLKVLRHLGVDNICISIDGYIKHHVGLGSTTRIVMSALTAIATLKKLDIDIVDEAVKLGRGKVSAVGIYTFIYGNLVIDSGVKLAKGVRYPPKPIAILPIPKDWYIILVVPEDIKGLSEDEETRIMNLAKEFKEQHTLYKYIVTLMSAVVHKDFKLFSRSLRELQKLTGEYFSEYQGGIYCCDVSSDIVSILESNGIVGIGQSSWGPTIYGFTDSYVKAIEVRNIINNFMNRRGLKGRVWITNVSNIGHKVSILLR